jgi:hypothetical protein
LFFVLLARYCNAGSYTGFEAQFSFVKEGKDSRAFLWALNVVNFQVKEALEALPLWFGFCL